jgi:hypothetical protein
MNIVVCQFSTSNIPYKKYTIEINKKYCDIKGYHYHVELEDYKIFSKLENRSVTWYKPHLIKEMLDLYKDVDYILFLDIDAVITDHSKRIEDYIDGNFSILMTKDYGSCLVNAGVMIVKNDDFSKNFMANWWDICEEYPEYKTGLWHDQTCIGLLYESLIDKNRFIVTDNMELNSAQYKNNEFIFHAFSYGNIRNRTIDSVYYEFFNIEPEVDSVNLMSLAEVYTTDKQYLHNYFSQVYQDIFYPIKDTVKIFIEIGILEGNSLKIFKRFFNNAKIYGVDLRSDIIDRDIEVEEREDAVSAMKGSPSLQL